MITRIRAKSSSGSAAYTLIRYNENYQYDELDLVLEAMCHRAANDLKSKDYEIKTDAMDFFRSKWFAFLTGLDGEKIIQRLLSKEGETNECRDLALQ